MARHGLGATAAHVGARVLWWAPAWLPLVLLLQLVRGGLAPARADEARLQRAGQDVEARVQGLLQEKAELETRGTMLSDPMYRARVDRTRHRAERPPLTLDEARGLATR